MTRKYEGGRSELHDAALRDDVDRARQLLADGAKPNARYEEGMTPLHFAAQEHALGVARLLLDHGARVNATDDHGNTPLWTAVFNSRGRGDMINLLREHGADPKKVNHAGRSPLDLARTIGNYDVKRFFADIDRAD